MTEFVTTPALCLLSLRPVAECSHCVETRGAPAGPGLVVTDVDRDRGVVTLSASDEHHRSAIGSFEGLKGWTPEEAMISNQPPRGNFFGVDRSLGCPSLATRAAELTRWQRFRWWLGYKVHGVACWILGGVP